MRTNLASLLLIAGIAATAATLEMNSELETSAELSLDLDMELDLDLDLDLDLELCTDADRLSWGQYQAKYRRIAAQQRQKRPQKSKYTAYKPTEMKPRPRPQPRYKPKPKPRPRPVSQVRPPKPMRKPKPEPQIEPEPKPIDEARPTGLGKPQWQRPMPKNSVRPIKGERPTGLGKRDWYKKKLVGKLKQKPALVLEEDDVAVTESDPEEKTVSESTPVAEPEQAPENAQSEPEVSGPPLTKEQQEEKRIKDKIASLPDGIREKMQAKYSGASAEQKEKWQNKLKQASKNFMKANEEGKSKTAFFEKYKDKMAMKKRLALQKSEKSFV